MSHIGKPNNVYETIFWDGYKFSAAKVLNNNVDDAAAIAGTKLSVTQINGLNVSYDVTPPTDGYVLTWENSNNRWTAKSVGLSFATYADARSVPSSLLANVRSIMISGRDSQGDGGAGQFVWNATSTDNTNDGISLRPDDIVPANPGRLVRVYSDSIYTKWFGSDEFALRNAILFAESDLSKTNVVLLPNEPINVDVNANGPILIGDAASLKKTIILRASSSGEGGFRSVIRAIGTLTSQPLVKILNVNRGLLEYVTIDSNSITDYGVQVFQKLGISLTSTTDCGFISCYFIGARVNNLLIGDTAPGSGDCSGTYLSGCYFHHQAGLTTPSHIRLNAWETFPLSVTSCVFTGDGTYPSHAISGVGGVVDVDGCELASLGNGDLHGEADINCPFICYTVDGCESQSYMFINADNTGSGQASQRPWTVTGCYHADITGRGSTTSIIWNVGTFAALVLNGFRSTLNIDIQHASADVFSNGVQFADTGADFIGYTQRVSGHWKKGSLFIQQGATSSVRNRSLFCYDQTYSAGAWTGIASLCGAPFASALNDEHRLFGKEFTGKLIIISDGGPGAVGWVSEWLIYNGQPTAVLQADPSTQYSTVAGTAGKVNLFWDIGTDRWVIQNKAGGLRITVVYLGTPPTF